MNQLDALKFQLSEKDRLSRASPKPLQSPNGKAKQKIAELRQDLREALSQRDGAKKFQCLSASSLKSLSR